MISSRSRAITSAFVVIGTFFAVGQDLAAQKRPIDHSDYDRWPSIRSTAYAQDGKWVAYTINPAWGDGVLHVQSVDGNVHYTHPRGTGPLFSEDARFLVFSVRDSVVEKRQKELEELYKGGSGETTRSGGTESTGRGARSSQMAQRFGTTRGPGTRGTRFGRGGRGGRGGGGSGSGPLLVMDLGTGKVEEIGKTKGFRVTRRGDLLLYQIDETPDAEAEPAAGERTPNARTPGARTPGGRTPGAGAPGGGARGQRGRRGGRTGGTRGAGPGGARGAFGARGNTTGGRSGPRGGPLVVRDLASGVETRYEGIVSYRLIAEDRWMLLTCAKPEPEPAAREGAPGRGRRGAATEEGAEKPAEKPAEKAVEKPVEGEKPAQKPKQKKGIQLADGLHAVELKTGKQVALLEGSASFTSFVTDDRNTKLAFASDLVDKMAAEAKKKAEAAKKKAEEEKKKAEEEAKKKAEPAKAAGEGAGEGGRQGAAGRRGRRGRPQETPPAAEDEETSSNDRRYDIYLWDFGPGPARRLIAHDDKGIPGGFKLQSSGLGFSGDGSVLTLGIRGAPAEDLPKILAEDKVELDIWHWRDGSIQPMQARGRGRGRSGNPTLTCVWHLADDKLVVLGDEDIPSVRLITPDGTRAMATDSKPYERLVTWDGRYSDVYLVNTFDGSRTKIKTQLRTSVQASPTGRWLLYFGPDYQWYAIDQHTMQEKCLTNRVGVRFENELEDRPQPARAHGIAGWTSGDRQVLINDRYDIWKIDLESGSATCVTDGYGRANEIVLRYQSFDFEGDNETLDPLERRYVPATILLSAKNDRTKARGYYTDSTVALQRPKRLVMLDRQFGGLTRAKKADRVFFTLSTFAEFPDIWVADLKLEGRRKLTDACKIQSEVRWGSSELVTWTNADGVDLKGLLMKPDGFDPKKQYPMMVFFYERNSDNLHRYRRPSPGTSPNAAYYVSNGYLWFVPDIIYTVGYPGESAEKCVISGVQHLIAQGFVDREAIGMAGHSWGGYQTAHLVTRTNLFAAAESGAPVSNMFSAYGGIRYSSGQSRQFQYERTQSRIGGTPWQYPQRYWQNSPVFYADRVQTPVLILHNDQDGAVPWTNGIEYFMALRRLDREAYLFNYKGEGHSVGKRQNKRDWTRRMAEFFAHHLKGAPAPEWMRDGVPYSEAEREKIQYAPSFIEASAKGLIEPQAVEAVGGSGGSK